MKLTVRELKKNIKAFWRRARARNDSLGMLFIIITPGVGFEFIANLICAMLVGLTGVFLYYTLKWWILGNKLLTKKYLYGLIVFTCTSGMFLLLCKLTFQ